jgi:predicted nucleic acid-binding protein
MTIEIAQGSAVYVDSNIFIYYVEELPGYLEKCSAMFSNLDEHGARILTSELTIAECLYRPARDANAGLIGVYEEFFGSTGDIHLIPLTGVIAKRAANSGGRLGLKLLDAMHYESALEAGCNVLLTADRKFKSSPTLRVLHI